MKSRKTALCSALIGIGALILGTTGCSKGKRPNVLLITIDTLRADHVGCYGFALARTRNIDALAREGVRCSNAITVAPITLPAHTSILTGLYPPAHGVRDNGAYALGDDVTTLAERLKQGGYRTQAFVSALVLNRRYNLIQGFDGYGDDLWSEDRPKLFMIRDRPARKTASLAAAWLDRWHAEPKRRPFFLWVHFFDPHQPYKPRFTDAYLSPSLYDGEITAADRGVGVILDKLKEEGILDDTLVILTADHGESLGEHQEKTHAIFIYDATVHVPLVLRYPRLLPSGKTYEGPVRPVDIVPTVLGVVGLAGKEETQGVDLLRALRGETPAPALPQYSESLLAEVGFGMAPLYGVRQAGYKWIRAPKPELYDLTADPKELQNLYSTEPKRAQDLDRALQSILDESRRSARAAKENPLDQETTEMLQALGYLASPAERSSLGGMDPKDGIVVYNKLDDARHRAQRDDWPGAAKLLGEILEVTPGNVSARNVLGLAEFRLGDLEEAKRQYLASLGQQPRQSRVYAMLGNIELKTGRYPDAERYFHQALEITPGFVEIMANLGFIELERGNESAAEEWYRKAIAIDPSVPRVYRRFADLYFERGDYAKALGYYQRTLQVVPQHFEALVQAGNSARQIGDTTAAADYYKRAGDALGDSWIPPYNLACLKATQGDPREALDLLGQAIDKGFRNVRRMEENDDFSSLRSLPAYVELVAKVRKAESRGRRGPRADAGKLRRAEPTGGHRIQ